MSWSPAQPIVPTAKAEIAASVCRFGSTSKSPLRLSISLRAPLFEQLKKPKSFYVAVGHGEHEGKIKLAPSGDVVSKMQSRGGGKSSRLSAFVASPGRARSSSRRVHGRGQGFALDASGVLARGGAAHQRRCRCRDANGPAHCHLVADGRSAARPVGTGAEAVI